VNCKATSLRMPFPLFYWWTSNYRIKHAQITPFSSTLCSIKHSSPNMT